MGGHIFMDAVRWLGKVFKTVKDDIDKVAITITEAIKTAAEGTIAQTISVFIDEALKSHLAEDVLNVVKIGAIKALSVELALQGLPDNPTGDDIQNFENQVYTAITGLQPSGASKLWTTLASQIYQLIHDAMGTSTNLTFAQIVNLVETAYQDYLKDKADIAAGNTSSL